MCVGVHMCPAAVFGAMVTITCSQEGQSKSGGAKMETAGRWLKSVVTLLDA